MEVLARFGAYVHIPFCATRCDYCDFATWTDRDHLIDTYVAACTHDVERQRRATSWRTPTSVFFGGGTPSLIPADQLVEILTAIAPEPDAEVTVECNPDSVDAEKLRTYRDGGVNRLSFGVQSMNAQVLQALGRTHDRDNVARAVRAARACGFERISLDLIYGTPGESVSDWESTLDGALALEPDHVSAYALTVEPGTPLGAAVVAGNALAPDDDDQAEKYELADDRLRDHGYEWYEISNWARPGQHCTHNLLYWSMGEYAAIGCAAHGHTDGTRWWNVRTPERYIDLIGTDGSALAGSESLDGDGRREEAFTLALRTVAGASVAPEARAAAVDLADAGLLVCVDAGRDVDENTESGSVVRLTRRGRLLASDVTARLLLAGAVRPGGGQPAREPEAERRSAD